MSDVNIQYVYHTGTNFPELHELAASPILSSERQDY
jgi:hypothetical protein